jgi:inosine-uridine nucleoside N-ribohydrolase
MAVSIVIDTDPGQDDAVAILLALAARDRIDVKAITAVAGNVGVEQTAANAIRICDLAERRDIPVHAGADRPLIFDLETAEFVCGRDGLAGADLPPPSRTANAGHAVEAIIQAARAAGSARISLCAIGPLTNIALALRLAPDIAAGIERIVLMGGAQNLGNMTPAAEYNVYVDPHAAAIVFNAGIPIVMFGLHVTHDTVPLQPELDAIRALGTNTGRVVHGMLTRPRPGGLGTAGHPMHDPCTVSWLLWPGLFEGRDCHVHVETGEGPLRGRTTIDWNGRFQTPANAHVIGAVNARKLYGNLIETLSHLP